MPAAMHPDFIIPDWPVAANVRALVTTRTLPGVSGAPFDAFNLGAHCGDEPGAVRENRRLLVELADLPAQPHWLKQVHGIEVQRFEAPPAPGSAVLEADASVTSTPGVVLSVQTAD